MADGTACPIKRVAIPMVTMEEVHLQVCSLGAGHLEEGGVSKQGWTNINYLCNQSSASQEDVCKTLVTSLFPQTYMTALQTILGFVCVLRCLTETLTGLLGFTRIR